MKVLKFENINEGYDVISSGILLYRFNPDLQFFLVRPGGPFYEGRKRSYGIPKGEVEGELFDSAIRELEEETGIKLNKNSEFINLGYVEETYLNKKIYAFAIEYNKEIEIKSMTLTRNFNGEMITFPEIDDGKWFNYKKALKNIRPAQENFIKRLNKHFGLKESIEWSQLNAYTYPEKENEYKEIDKMDILEYDIDPEVTLESRQSEDYITHCGLKFFKKVNLMDLAKTICKQLGYDEPEYLGKGGYGVAFSIGDDVVLKFTSDEEEAQNAFFLLNKEPENLIEYYDVYKIMSDEILNTIYVLIMEYLLPLTDEENKMMTEIKDIVGVWSNDLLEMLKNSEKELIQWSEKHKMYDVAREMVDGLFNIAEECELYDISTIDVKAANCGWSGDGQLVYFDVGATTNRDYRMLPKIKIEI